MSAIHTETELEHHSGADHLARFDLDYWLALPYWTVPEAAALSVDASPELFTRAVERRGGLPTLIERRLRHIQRALDSGELPQKPRPLEVVAWLEVNAHPIPRSLTIAVAEFRAQSMTRSISEAVPPMLDPEELETRPRKTLLRLVLGMAMHKYHFDTELLKQSVATNISAGLGNVGLSVKEDTIRKWLKIAQAEVGSDLTCTKWPPRSA